MADSILTPGYQNINDTPQTSQEETQYLKKDNFLSEYGSDEEKSIVRENLNIPSKDSVYSKQDVDTKVSEKIQSVIQEYLNMEDPYGILPQVAEMIADFVKVDGSTPFTQPQTGVDPQTDNHLATKKYIDKQLKEHVSTEDPHNILQKVNYILQQYVKNSEVYTKSQVYTQQEIDNQAKQYIRNDGTTPFTKAQIGADPQIDGHLATKRYVDKTLYQHLVDVDPHGFLSILNSRLASYTKKKDIYDKTQTYSRTQIDSIINNLVNQAVDYSIQNYTSTINDKIENLQTAGFVKQDGSVPFFNPQSGVDAVEDQQLATLRQVNKSAQTIKDLLEQEIQNKECLWIPNGPVEATVGQVEDNTTMPSSMTLQEVCDAIFYGSRVSITVPEYVTITESCKVTICIHGSTGLVQYAELYQNDELIYTIQKSELEDGCITLDSLPLQEDTTFTAKVYYTNGVVHESSAVVKCYLPVFVGLLPQFKFGNTITMDYLIQLSNEDSEGTQNRFLNYGKDLESFTFKYVFQDSELRHPFIVIPESYPDLESMTTKSQSFGIDAFEVIDMIPLSVPGVEEDIIYKIYIYKQALSSLNQDVTFNFKKE